ncbi:MAG: N-acetylmuramoyl-L-alanine amidase [Candidatus Limnocylindria bacterium]
MNPHRPAPIVVAILLASALGVGSPGVGRTDAAVLPLAGMVIAVDPGHNGGNVAHTAQMYRLVWAGNRWKACATAGTTTVSGYPEHKFNFAVALRVKARLEALGATVYLTRPSDTGFGPCVDERGRFGTKVHARLTVSIHADGSGSSHRGFYVMRPGLVRGGTEDIIGRSAALARALRAGLLGAGLPIANYYTSTGIRTRTDYATFNLADVPVVMVELGNMKNSGDARRMKSASGRDRYAAGIVAGIRLYLDR